MLAIVTCLVTSAALLAVFGLLWLLRRHFDRSSALRRAERRPRDITSDALLPVLTGEGAGHETIIARVQVSPRRGYQVLDSHHLSDADVYDGDGESATDQAAAYARLRARGEPPHRALPVARKAGA